MKLYWPCAVDINNRKWFTYSSCLTLEECYKSFDCWESGYHMHLLEMWIDVEDTEDINYKERLEVKRKYESV